MLSANSATIKSVFATARDGDKIVLTGVFGRTKLDNRSFAKGLIIDAYKASFGGQLTMTSVAGVTVRGGLFGHAPGDWQNGLTVRVDFGDRISFVNSNFVGAGIGRETGLGFRQSTNISVTNSRFTGLRLGIGIGSVTNATLTSNTFFKSTSDGINIADSHNVTARSNLCKGGSPSFGAHPDCIQLWSLTDRPMQSDIQLLNNKAFGYTQGFTSFDPDAASGRRISMIGNWVETSAPQGIACYGCFDSVISNNTLLTIPGSRWRTNLNVLGGANNIVASNNFGPFVKPKPLATNFSRIDGPYSQAMTAFTADAGPDFDFGAPTMRYDETFAAFGTAAAIPEPAVWLQLIFGLGCAGVLIRQRRTMATA